MLLLISLLVVEAGMEVEIAGLDIVVEGDSEVEAGNKVESAGLDIAVLSAEVVSSVEETCDESWDVLAASVVVVGIELVSRAVDEAAVRLELAAKELLWLTTNDEETCDGSCEVLAAAVLADELELITRAVEDSAADVDMLTARELLWLVNCATADDETCDGNWEVLASPELVGRLGLAVNTVDDNSATDVERLAAKELLWLVCWATPDDETDGISDILAAPELVGKLELAAKAVDENCAIDVRSVAVRELLCNVNWAVPDEEACGRVSEPLVCPKLVDKLKLAPIEVDDADACVSRLDA